MKGAFVYLTEEELILLDKALFDVFESNAQIELRKQLAARVKATLVTLEKEPP